MEDSLRKVLGDNLSRLMGATAGLNSTPAVEKATDEAGLKIGKSTVARMLHADTPVNLDFVEVLAKVFDVMPWQLLVPGLDPKNKPAIAGVGAAQLPLLTELSRLARQIVALEQGSTRIEQQVDLRKRAGK